MHEREGREGSTSQQRALPAKLSLFSTNSSPTRGGKRGLLLNIISAITCHTAIKPLPPISKGEENDQIMLKRERRRFAVFRNAMQSQASKPLFSWEHEWGVQAKEARHASCIQHVILPPPLYFTLYVCRYCYKRGSLLYCSSEAIRFQCV